MTENQSPSTPLWQSRRARLFGGALLALIAMLLIAGWMFLQRDTPPPAGMVSEEEELPEDIPELPADITYGERQDILPPMIRISAESATELEQAFASFGYDWPPGAEVPALSVAAFPPLGELSVDERKSIFFRTLMPLIVAENQIMLATRQAIADAYDGGAIEADSREERMLQTLAARFRVEGDVNDPAFRDELLRRIDVVPPSMALAQAANESGWGQSRFTREANNLFGVWTWQEGRGIVPEQRAAGATHMVRVFSDLRASVRNYLYTINVGNAYSGLRGVREDLRGQGEALSGIRLAEGLEEYSERGQAYVDEIQSMIRVNALEEMDRPELVPVDAQQLLDAPVESVD